jgi:hypothetical protein
MTAFFFVKNVSFDIDLSEIMNAQNFDYQLFGMEN